MVYKRPSRAGCKGISGKRGPGVASGYQVLVKKCKKKEKELEKEKKKSRKLTQDLEKVKLEKKAEEEKRKIVEGRLAMEEETRKIVEGRLAMEAESRQDLVSAGVRARLVSLGVVTNGSILLYDRGELHN